MLNTTLAKEMDSLLLLLFLITIYIYYFFFEKRPVGFYSISDRVHCQHQCANTRNENQTGNDIKTKQDQLTVGPPAKLRLCGP